MKKLFVNICFALFLTMTVFSFAGCFGGGDPPPVNYNADVEVVAPENIDMEHFVIEDNATYYTSKSLSLVMSVNGAFLIHEYFELDGDNRIYKNLYFYENDYIFMITGDYSDIFASLKEESDEEYAEEEKESGEDIQINFIKSGIYTIIFDTENLVFDLQFTAEIETPRYYRIKNCEIYSINTGWVQMSINPNNYEEYYITNFNIESGKTINFFNSVHTSNYIPTLEENSQKYATCRKTNIKIKFGGNYNVYINSKTYKVRLELINVETADYSCCYYNGNDFVDLELESQSIPYVFVCQLSVDTQYTSVPDFYTKNYIENKLTLVNSPNIMTSSSNNYYFKNTGTYNIKVNLKTFELAVELLPE